MMKKALIIFLLAAMLLSVCSVLAVSAATLPLGAKLFGGHYYKYYDIQLTWTEAEIYCKERGGHLATISGSLENEFVASLFTCTSVWIGGHDMATEGSFQWNIDEPFAYKNWDSGEPNGSKSESCIELYRNGKWNDEEGSEVQGFVCEWESWEEESAITIPSNAALFEDHYYAYYALECDWESAEYYCERLGGHLATISSVEENEFVNSLSQEHDIWIGGTDRTYEGVFEWISGEPFDYNNWDSGEPNDGYSGQDYIQMYDNGYWDDAESDEIKTFVCEWDYCCKATDGYYEKHQFSDWEITKGSVFVAPIEKERECSRCSHVEEVTDWGYVWVTVLGVLGVICMLIGTVGYISAFRRR